MTIYDERREQHNAMILAALGDGEKTSKEIARGLPIGMQRITRCIMLMLGEGKMHVARTFGSRRYYRAGATGPRQASVAERILAALAAGPMTAEQIGEALNLSAVYVREIIAQELSKGNARQVYIAKYIRRERQRVHQYALGNLPDAKRPKPYTDAQKAARYRARRKKDVEKVITDYNRAAARYTKPRPDAVLSQFAGLFGQRLAA